MSHMLPKYNISEINHLIQNRRSVKPEKFSSKAVDRSVIEAMLENANWAPTHGLTEPWRFKIFEGEGRNKLGAFQANWYKKTMPAEKFHQAKYDKLLNRPLKATFVIAICMKRLERARIPVIEDVEAVACAVQNMHLTATAYGLVGYWTSGGPTYTQELKKFLDLGEEDKCLGFFYVGYFDGEWPHGKREPIAEKITWITE